MFAVEFGIFDQGGNLVFIGKKGNLDSYHGSLKGGPGQEEAWKGGDRTGHFLLGLVVWSLSVAWSCSTGS